MPYVITTSEPFDAAEHVHQPAFSRYAAATLDEAREAIVSAVAGTSTSEAVLFDARVTYADTLPEQGGTVGPLPDGTVIEVERVMLSNAFFRAAGLSNFDTPHMSDAAIIAAYNAAQ